MEASIESYGAYIPRLRIDSSEFEEAWGSSDARGVEEKRVPEADEDAVTMAVEAVEDALGRSSYDREDIDTLAFGTTTPPLDEGEVGAQVAGIVGFDRNIEVVEHAQSARAGVRSLLTAESATEEGGGVAVAVAADCPFGKPDDGIDHAAGAGAVAFVVDDEDTGAVEVKDTASYTQEFSGTRFRERGETTVEKYGATPYERDAYTTVVSGAFEGIDASDAVLAPTAPDADLPYRAGRTADAEVYENASSFGDTGAVSALFGVIDAWRNDEDDVVVVGYGDGASADAVHLVGSLPVEWERDAEDISHTEYLRRRGHVVGEGGDA
jgi:hydroxymethylglutaryl-CoA synthase